MAGSSSSFRRIVAALALLLGALTLVGGWLFWGRRQERREARREVSEISPPVENRPAPVDQERAHAPPPARPAPPRATPAHVATDGIGFPPLHDGDPRPPGPLHAHPITPTRERIFAENRIANALDDATDAQDLTAMKALLEQYRRDFPDDHWQLQSGYAVIIDCLEHPGVPARAAAERWLETNNGSTVKRSVLRDCFPPASGP